MQRKRRVLFDMSVTFLLNGETVTADPATATVTLLDWLREVRAGKRAYQPEELKRRVLELSRARLDYDALRIEFDEIDGLIDFEQFQQQTQGAVLAQFAQIVDAGIEMIARTVEGIDEATESGHGLENQYRKLLLGHPQAGGETTDTAAHDDAVKICQCFFLVDGRGKTLVASAGFARSPDG